jgi:hypothetical protein
MGMKTLTVGAVCVAMVLGCGSSGGTGTGGGGGSSAFDGTWTGTWLDGNVQGDITFTLSGSNGTLSGSVSFTNSPCFASGAVTGTYSGDSLNGEITAGAIAVTITGTATGDQMSGTFDAVSAGACTGDTGTFTASQ